VNPPGISGRSSAEQATNVRSLILLDDQSRMVRVLREIAIERRLGGSGNPSIGNTTCRSIAHCFRTEVWQRCENCRCRPGVRRVRESRQGPFTTKSGLVCCLPFIAWNDSATAFTSCRRCAEREETLKKYPLTRRVYAASVFEEGPAVNYEASPQNPGYSPHRFSPGRLPRHQCLLVGLSASWCSVKSL